jgi:hypothetical protein
LLDQDPPAIISLMKPAYPGRCLTRTPPVVRFLLFALTLIGGWSGVASAGEWQSGPGYRRMALPVGANSGKPGFALMPSSATGVLFSNVLPQSVSITNQILLDGSGVAAGDIDGDGRLDLALSNWGRNTKYQSHRVAPLKLYHGAVNGDNTVQLIEAYFDPDLQKTVPALQLGLLARGLPWLRGRFASYREYSVVSIEEMLGDRRGEFRTLQVEWLESMILLNRGDRFELRILPVEAQMAPAFGICAADFDGDGAAEISAGCCLHAGEAQKTRASQ